MRPGSSGQHRTAKSNSPDGYRVAKIEAVQVRVTDSDYGLLWPTVTGVPNAYVISGNPFIVNITDELQTYLQTIQEELGDAVYTPCKIKLPACLDITAGDIIKVVDRNGFGLDMYVMSKTQKGQIETLECTGSPRRDSSTVKNNSTIKDLQEYAEAAASAAVKRQDQQDIFDRLTNGGLIQGLFMAEDGQIYINAQYIATGILASKDGTSFYLDLDTGTFHSVGKFMSQDGNSYVTVDGNEFTLYAKDDSTGKFLPKFRLGFNSDLDGVDYPWILLGNSDEGSMGLVKKFTNGLWVGNSVPLDAVGNFTPLSGAAGFFINTANGTPYTVADGVMRDITVAVFG